ncbi:hypothetical protein [Streptomyces sp. 5-10]|uniref:hypothetical protein n=1 Tax=Streptomyces sp. 5-10 TaxID=878925 RepID=UPI00168B9226|nr:hypothetical protein [Streptomyces sp. 5-10]MBD3004646.1 hypothetical protein [Streptomyces sp. 5-10]
MKELPEDQLAGLLGPVGIREYQQAPDYDKPKIREWLAGLSEMPDSDLIVETASHILDDAIMRSFPRQNSYGIGCRVTACYEEAKRRHVAAGHDKECRGETLYSKGHAHAMRNQGHNPGERAVCTCGREGQ